MSCIGTAGHIDHGKSALVQALTGIDPDRLAEEKRRGMTIEAGFAWLTMPSGREISIVDVPGHERFIKNMLAGVGGIDAAILVIAADEGIMPQTREHLAILDLLGIQGVVALTKSDLADDEWLLFVQTEVQTLLATTTLAYAPIIPVSAYTGQGLKELVTELDRLLTKEQARPDRGRPRLPVDRVFSLTGFGTVVTGTLLDGTFSVGQSVEIMPQGLAARIRTLQTHKRQIERANPGSRVALNLPDIAPRELARGNVITLAGQQQATTLCDVWLHVLSSAAGPLKQNAQLDCYSGAQEIPVRVRLLDRDSLEAGESTWAQLRLNQPAILAHRDRFILRTPSPGETIGGGEIIDVQPRYHRRVLPTVLKRLEQLREENIEGLLLAVLEPDQTHRTGYQEKELARVCNLADDVTRQALETLLSEEQVKKIGSYWLAKSAWEALVGVALAVVNQYHYQNPLRLGMPKEEWRSRLHLKPELARDLLKTLQEEGQLKTAGPAEHYPGRKECTRNNLLQLPAFTVRFTEIQQRQIKALLAQLRECPYMPPGHKEIEEQVGTEVVYALIEQGYLVHVGENSVWLREAYEEAVHNVIAHLRTHTTITAGEVRDLLETTRKYSIPLLELMDAQQLTQRQGNIHRIGPNARD